MSRAPPRKTQTDELIRHEQRTAVALRDQRKLRFAGPITSSTLHPKPSAAHHEHLRAKRTPTKAFVLTRSQLADIAGSEQRSLCVQQPPRTETLVILRAITGTSGRNALQASGSSCPAGCKTT